MNIQPQQEFSLPQASEIGLPASFGRELEPQDLALLESVPATRLTSLTSIQKLKHSHHLVARLVARGARPAEISLKSGYSISRISELRNVPAFKELVEFYRHQVQETFADVNERIALVSLDYLEELQRRIDEEPKSLKTDDIIKVVSLTLDRSGHGPTSTVNSNVAVLTGDDLAKLRKAEASALKGVITIQNEHTRIGQDAKLERSSVELASLPDSAWEPAVGPSGVGSAVKDLGQNSEASGSEGQGDSIPEISWETSPTTEDRGTNLRAVDCLPDQGGSPSALGETGSLSSLPGADPTDRVQADLDTSGLHSNVSTLRSTFRAILQPPSSAASGLPQPPARMESGESNQSPNSPEGT